MPGEGSSVNILSKLTSISKPEWIKNLKPKKEEKPEVVDQREPWLTAENVPGIPLFAFEIPVKKKDPPKIVAKIKQAHAKNMEVIKKNLFRKLEDAATTENCDPPMVDELIADFEAEKIRSKRRNLEVLDSSIQKMDDSDPDKAYYIARQALILARTEKKKNVEEARLLFEDAKVLNGSDPRVRLLEAGFHILLGEYNSALKIYKHEIKRAKETGNCRALEALSYDLISFEVLLNNEIMSIPLEKKKEAVESLLKVVSFIMNPISLVDHVIKEIAEDVVMYERPEVEEKDLLEYKSKAGSLAKKAITGLKKAGDAASLISLGNSLVEEHDSRNRSLYLMSQVPVEDRAVRGLPVGDAEVSMAMASHQELLFTYYPLIAQKALDAAVEEEDVETLTDIGHSVASVVHERPDYNSSFGLLIENLGAQAERAFLEASKLSDDETSLGQMGKQMILMGRYEGAVQIYEKMAAGDEKYEKHLDLANMALGTADEKIEPEEKKEFEGMYFFDDMVIKGVTAEGIDPAGLYAALKLVNGNDLAVARAAMSYYRSKGYRARVGSGDIRRYNGTIGVNVNEISIKEVMVSDRVRNGRLGSWIEYYGRGELSPGKAFNEDELENSLLETSKRLETFSPSESRWEMFVDENNDAVVLVDVRENLSRHYEIGAGTTTSGRNDLLGMLRIKHRFASGKNVSLDMFSGKRGDESVLDASASYYTPDMFTLRDKKISSDISVFRTSFVNYVDDEVETMTGAGVKMGTEIKRNTSVWVNPRGYALQNGSAEDIKGVGTVYSGLTYNTLNGNKGSFFQIYGGPIIWETLGGKVRAKAVKRIPLPKEASLVLISDIGLGNSLPTSEKFVFGRNQTEFRGMLDKAYVGGALALGTVELRSKVFKMGGVGVQPYVFMDAGGVTDLEDFDLKFIPWYGGGMRLYMPYMGCVNIFVGSPFGPKFIPQPGFEFGQEAAL